MPRPNIRIQDVLTLSECQYLRTIAIEGNPEQVAVCPVYGDSAPVCANCEEVYYETAQRLGWFDENWNLQETVIARHMCDEPNSLDVRWGESAAVISSADAAASVPYTNSPGEPVQAPQRRPAYNRARELERAQESEYPVPRRYGLEIEIEFEDRTKIRSQRCGCWEEECRYCYDEDGNEIPYDEIPPYSSGYTEVTRAATYLGWDYRYDGSLSSTGLEIVTKPLKLEAVGPAMNEFFGKVEKYLDRDSEDPGTHVHTLRTLKNYQSVWRLRKMLNDASPPNQRFLDRLFRREANGYCIRRFPGGPKYYAQRGPNGHYDAISYSANFATWEFRMFAGSYTAMHATAAAETTDMMLAWQGTVGYHELVRPEKYMRHYIVQRRRDYPALFEMCTHMGLVDQPKSDKSYIHIDYTPLPRRSVRKKGVQGTHVHYYSQTG